MSRAQSIRDPSGLGVELGAPRCPRCRSFRLGDRAFWVEGGKLRWGRSPVVRCLSCGWRGPPPVREVLAATSAPAESRSGAVRPAALSAPRPAECVCDFGMRAKASGPFAEEMRRICPAHGHGRRGG